MHIQQRQTFSMRHSTSLHKYALLVIDMQEEFRQCAVKIVNQLNKTIQICRQNNVPVIFTQHGHRQPSIDAGQLVEQWGSVIEYGSKEWQMMPEVNLLPTDYIISEKRRYDAFYGTILGEMLRKLDVNTLVISGVMTNLCCETTTRSAFVRDFRVFFLSDGTATVSEEMHKASLLNISYAPTAKRLGKIYQIIKSKQMQKKRNCERFSDDLSVDQRFNFFLTSADCLTFVSDSLQKMSFSGNNSMKMTDPLWNSSRPAGSHPVNPFLNNPPNFAMPSAQLKLPPANFLPPPLPTVNTAVPKSTPSLGQGSVPSFPVSSGLPSMNGLVQPPNLSTFRSEDLFTDVALSPTVTAAPVTNVAQAVSNFSSSTIGQTCPPLLPLPEDPYFVKQYVPPPSVQPSGRSMSSVSGHGIGSSPISEVQHNFTGLQYPISSPINYIVPDMGNLNLNAASPTRTTVVDLLQEKHPIPSECLEPPVVTLPRPYDIDLVSSDSSVLRCTLTTVPESPTVMKKCRLPLGLILHPFKDLKKLVMVETSIIVRCRSCRAYINPYVRFVDRNWNCNICGRANLPDEFYYNPQTGKIGDPSLRPEIQNSSIEFIAPAHEYENRPPQPACYIFILDVSARAVQSGYLVMFRDVLLESLRLLPGDNRTIIGFIAVDSFLHFFQLRENLKPKEFVVSDVDDIVMPSKSFLLFYLDDSMNATIGGRLTVFQTVLPDIGNGSLTSREDPNLRAAKEVTNMSAASDFYKNLALKCTERMIAVDLFVLGDAYVDLATVCDVVSYSSGSVYYYPNFDSCSNTVEMERFRSDFGRYLRRKIGFEAVMRIRLSYGLSVHSFFGNFFVCSSNMAKLSNVNPDSAFGVLLNLDDNIDQPVVCIQAAILYSTCHGQRRIRVHTICLPTSESILEIHNGADLPAIIALISRMAVDRCLNQQGTIQMAREASINAVVDCLYAFRSASGSREFGTLLCSRNMRLFPIFILALLKCKAFAHGYSIKLDHRISAMLQFKIMPISNMILELYPNLYALHAISESNPAAPLLPLSFEKIDRHGLYLMDTGRYMYLYVGQGISDTLCKSMFGVSSYKEINSMTVDLEDENGKNEQGMLICNFMRSITSDRLQKVPVRIIKEDSPSKELFLTRLIDDRSETSFSYVEFLNFLQKEICGK
ncbi:Protein transport protein Sec24B [Trichinella papuae]|uniref:Protein transport protein Sec24B n=1 Tax=Trichinella papuae TaxID=268474 RepID=A0A0V1N607_9BILA|nr:Protein transport protein Sec24B [Trichinella papuae]